MSVLRVLHVEDRARDVALLTRHLSRAGYELVSRRVETPEAMGAALETEEWDIVLCDYSMPHFSALGALALLKETGLDIPFIIISGTVGEETAVEAMRAGAHDYLMKDKLARLAPTIERELAEAKNRRARREAEEALRASEAELRAIFEAMSDAVLVIDAEGRFLKVPPTKPPNIYRPGVEWVGKTIHDLFPQEKADFFLAQVRRALAERRTLRVEYSLPIGGREMWFDVSVSPMATRSVMWIARDITERKQAEDDLRRQKEILQKIFDHIPVMVSFFDADGRLTLVNREWERTVGWTPEEVREQNLDIFAECYPDPEERRKVRDFLATPNGHWADFYTKVSDGRMIETTWAVVRLSDGTSISIGQDITERKQAEERLRHQLDFTAAITASMGEGVYALDEDGRLTFMNPAAEAALGWTEAELLGRRVHEVIHFQHADGVPRPAHDCPLLGVLTSGQTCRGEDDVFTRRDGTLLPVSFTAAPILTGGRVIGTVLAFRDITERRRAEEERERLAAIVESSDDAILSKDLDGRVTSWNAGAERMYGYAAAEAVGRHVSFIVPPDRREELSGLMEQVARGERVRHLETIRIRKDGRRVEVSLSIAPMKDGGGRVVGASTIARDLTERKRLEEQFRQAQKMEAVGRLAGGVAHDFNNLLTVINGYSDITIGRLSAEDPLRLHVEEVRKAGERAAGLTRQLLAFSRKQVLRPEVIDLNEVVRETEKMLRRLIGEDIVLRVALGPGLGSVKADPGQVEQVLMNLAVNARDAMPRGGRLTIGTENVHLDEEYAARHVSVAPGRYVMLAVSDTGAGMDEETRARIFEPFFTTKEQGKGTGLGLSTVYGIVKQSGGHIWVYSEAGRGTTFKIYLPRVDAGAREHRPAAESAEGLTGTETILLAEDDELVRNMTCIILSDYGYRVLAAENGAAAISIFESTEEPIHLLLTDVVMPGISGRELADRLTRLRPETKVLYMSGYTEDAIVHHGVLEEGVNFLQKPFTPDALARRVREILGSAK